MRGGLNKSPNINKVYMKSKRELLLNGFCLGPIDSQNMKPAPARPSREVQNAVEIVDWCNSSILQVLAVLNSGHQLPAGCHTCTHRRSCRSVRRRGSMRSISWEHRWSSMCGGVIIQRIRLQPIGVSLTYWLILSPDLRIGRTHHACTEVAQNKI